jgi:DNA-binding NarL/FixJ family response regulator
MAENRIIVVSGEACPFEWISRELSPLGVGRVCGVTAVDDLADVLEDPHVALVVYVRRGRNDRRRIARTLWHVSRSRRPAPVVVVDDAYTEADALTFLRMGASDYLSVADHGDRLGSVIAELLAPSMGSAVRVVPRAVSGQPLHV